MPSYLDLSDASLLTLVGRLDRDALGELFRRYGIVVLVAAGWAEANAANAEQRAVEVFLDVWGRPEAYAAGSGPIRSSVVRAALTDAAPEAVRLAATRLAQLEGWTYHDVAEVLARPHRQIALIIREQLNEMRRDT